jgi:hypothetical protein
MEGFYPGEYYGDDEGWYYPDNDEPDTADEPDYLERIEQARVDAELAEDHDLPTVPTETIRDTYIYNRILEEEPCEECGFYSCLCNEEDRLPELPGDPKDETE